MFKKIIKWIKSFFIKKKDKDIDIKIFTYDIITFPSIITSIKKENKE